MSYADRNYKNKHDKITLKYDWSCSENFFGVLKKLFAFRFGTDDRIPHHEYNFKECSIGHKRLRSNPYKDKFIL